MVSKELADKLTLIAAEQLSAGLEARKKRMSDIEDFIDLYNNKVLEFDDGVTNIPFPILASHIDIAFSKIDDKPRVSFKIPNKKLLSQKIEAVWEQERTSMRAGWNRKDRAEKKLALLTGRGIAKVFASSVGNKYRSHYEVIDPFTFVADPTRGHLEDGMFHGCTDIFKTHASLKKGAEKGIYDQEQVDKLLLYSTDPERSSEAQERFARLKSLGISTPTDAYIRQNGVLLTEWIMRYEDERYYLLFDPKTLTWVRAKVLKDQFKSDTSPYISWAVNYDEYAFWTKGYADDIYPIAEAMRLVLNTVIENEKRRARPMRIVEAGSLVDVNELMDYVPDNVIIANKNANMNIIDVQTPQVGVSINVVQFLDAFMQEKTGVSGTGVAEQDAKVGVYYGQLQQEADRYGVINKAYSESYAEKGYRFFWGLKEHLTGSKPVEMLGKSGVRLEELKSVEFSDVKDVDDVITYGGQAEKELDAIESRQQAEALSSISGNPELSQFINKKWLIKTTMQKSGFNDEDINEALDVQSDTNSELMQEADEAIASILNGKMPKLNQGATVQFMQRILDYVRDNLDYIEIDNDGQFKRVDEKIKKYHDQLLVYVQSHQQIVLRNARKFAQDTIEKNMMKENASNEQVSIPEPTEQEQQLNLAQPFENPQGTPEGTAEASQVISETLTG